MKKYLQLALASVFLLIASLITNTRSGSLGVEYAYADVPSSGAGYYTSEDSGCNCNSSAPGSTSSNGDDGDGGGGGGGAGDGGGVGDAASAGVGGGGY